MAGWILLEQNPSSSGSGIYDLRRGGDGVLYCTCRGWLSNKNAHRKTRQEHLPAECKHTKDYVARTGTSYGPQYETKKVKPGKPGKPAPVVPTKVAGRRARRVRGGGGAVREPRRGLRGGDPGGLACRVWSPRAGRGVAKIILAG